MHAKIVTFAASALFALTSAVPMNNEKRDIVWVTEIETAIETVPVTTTVWVDPTGTPDKGNHRGHGRYGGHGGRGGHGGHGGHPNHHKQEQDIDSSIEVQPTPSPEPASIPETTASSESAPAPSSHEAPPAPSSYEAPSSTSSEEAAPAPSSYEAPASSEEAAPAPSSYEAPSSSSEAAPVPSSTTEVESTTSTPAPVAPATTEAPPAPVSSYEAPSTSYEAPATSSAAAPPSYDSGSELSSPASGSSYTGEMTYFTPGMGACGHSSSEGDQMVAISHALFDQYTPGGNPNKNPLCGSSVTIKGADGSDYTATIWDRCVGCAEADLDMPQEFFNKVTAPKDGPPADGRAYGMEWSIN